MENRIYADHAATTKLREEALEAMLPWLREGYGNASSLYKLGREARKAVENARRTVAGVLGADKNEIFFNSGGTEGDNTALRGVMACAAGRHIVSTAMEHHAVLHTLEALEKSGCSVTLVQPDRTGHISPDDIRAALRPDTALISVMTVNNELGTIQPIREIAALAHERGILFHTDAVQAAGHIPLNVRELGVDLLTLSAHKFGGPKGAGAIYIRRGTPCAPYMTGGAQEHGTRAGTENVAGIVGLARALELSAAEADEEARRLTALRRRLTAGILQIPHVRENGGEPRLPGIANFSFAAIEGEYIAMMLDNDGIAVSPGSACAAGSEEPSHVLTAIGLDRAAAKGGLRISLGRENTQADVDAILASVQRAAEKLRAMSPTWSAMRHMGML
ncbi:MAG: cysteine desulfurase family protein [Clostridiaceae bacterium]|nr:cysteine desulfurase family protein [Clostridiaceae bacterium]